MVPLKVLRKDPCLPLLVSGVCQQSCCYLAYRCITPISASVIMSASCPSVYDSSYFGCRAHLTQVWTHLTWWHLGRPYFQTRSYSEIPDRHEFGVDTIQLGRISLLAPKNAHPSYVQKISPDPNFPKILNSLSPKSQIHINSKCSKPHHLNYLNKI